MNQTKSFQVVTKLDQRDYKLNECSDFALKEVHSLPPVVDHRNYCTSIEDQSFLQSCTAHALTSAIEFLNCQHRNAAPDLSRLFLYFHERKIDSNIWLNTPVHITTGLKVLASIGIPLESLWPYDTAKFSKPPPDTVLQDAATRRIKTYARVPNSIGALKQVIASDYPVVLGFRVFNNAYQQAGKTGVMPMPDVATDKPLGGHAVLIVGYDDSTQHFLIRNSYGAKWGSSGYFAMPYQFVTRPEFAFDLWTITL